MDAGGQMRGRMDLDCGFREKKPQASESLMREKKERGTKKLD